MLRVFNDTARYVDQGGGKRRGAIAVYLEPWHADVFEFLELRKNQGAEELRARDLFLSLWVPDLFMRRVEANSTWSLFCPAEAPGLSDAHGAAFEELYLRYETTPGLARRTFPAQELWQAVVDSQIETGTPYVLFKDAVNAKSNQQNLGTIKLQPVRGDLPVPVEVAVCNPASIALPRFVTESGASTTSTAAGRGDQCPHPEQGHRPHFLPGARGAGVQPAAPLIGTGVRGGGRLLPDADAYDEEARALNRDIFETIYYGAPRPARRSPTDGPYETFRGSPASEGRLSFDLWGAEPSGRWDWAALRARVRATGMRNSLLLAPMPTASTSQMLGYNECFEPYTSNIYSRRVLSGEFVCVNQHLVRDLIALGLWTEEMRNRIIAAGGSVQGIDEIPAKLREIYRTVWEIKQRSVIDMAADRGAFIDQSQSMNLFLRAHLRHRHGMLFHAWKRGCKTACTTCAPPRRQRHPVHGRQGGLEASKKADHRAPSCSMEEGCLMCGS